MTEYFGLIQQALVFGFFITFIVAVASHFIYPVLKNKIQNICPEQQSIIVFGWSILPVFSSFFITFIALLPSLLQILGISTDHCLGHSEGHIHFCLIHLNEPVNSVLVWGLAFLYLGLLLVTVLSILADIYEAFRFKIKLKRLNPEKIDKDIFLLSTDTPLALTCGSFFKQIFLSSGLLDNLSKDEYAIVINHERAHINRRDALKKLIARGFSLSHFPGTRKRLLSHLILANEQACDNASISRQQDKPKAAELLVKIEKLYQGHFFTQSALSSGVMVSTDNILVERVHNLLNNKKHPSLIFPLLLCFSTLNLALFLSHDLIHDGLEHLMYLLSISIT